MNCCLDRETRHVCFLRGLHGKASSAVVVAAFFVHSYLFCNIEEALYMFTVKRTVFHIVTDDWNPFSHNYRWYVLLAYRQRGIQSTWTPRAALSQPYVPSTRNLPFRVKVTG